MKTRYLTFILRFRLSDNPSHQSAGDQISGSVQQIGLQEIIYFDTPEKFQETLRQLIARLSPKEMKYGNSD